MERQLGDIFLSLFDLTKEKFIKENRMNTITIKIPNDPSRSKGKGE